MRFSVSDKTSESGYSLVIVLLISVVLLTLLAAVGSMVMAESKSTDWQAKKKQAYYLAEGGIERFMSALHQAGELSAYPTNQTELDTWMGNLDLPWSMTNSTGHVELKAVYREDGLIDLTSVGKINGSKIEQEIDVTVQLASLPKIFTYALGAQEFDVSGNPNLTLRGNFYLNGEAKIKNGLQIQDGVIDLGPKADLNSSNLQGLPVQRLENSVGYPSYQELFDSLQDVAYVSSRDTERLSALKNQAQNVIFFDQDLKLIVDSDPNPEKTILIVSQGNIEVVSDQDKKNKNSFKSFTAFLYSPNGSIQFEIPNFHLNGGVVAGQQVELEGGKGNTDMEIAYGLETISGFSNMEPMIISRRTK